MCQGIWKSLQGLKCYREDTNLWMDGWSHRRTDRQPKNNMSPPSMGADVAVQEKLLFSQHNHKIEQGTSTWALRGTRLTLLTPGPPHSATTLRLGEQAIQAPSAHATSVLQVTARLPCICKTLLHTEQFIFRILKFKSVT